MELALLNHILQPALLSDSTDNAAYSTLPLRWGKLIRCVFNFTIRIYTTQIDNNTRLESVFVTPW